MEVRDLWPESIAAVGLISTKSFAYKLLEFFEVQLYKSASGIVVVTESFKSYIIKKVKLKNKNNVIVIKNGVTLKNILNDEITNYGKQFKNKFVISYIGTHGLAHGLDFILDCIDKINDKTFHFIFIGDGAKKEELLDIKNKKSIGNVTFFESVPKHEVNKYILMSDAALVNLRKSKTFKSVIPSKIFENVALLKPILLGVEGESKQLIEKYEVGITYEPENFESFKNALSKIKRYSKTKRF